MSENVIAKGNLVLGGLGVVLTILGVLVGFSLTQKCLFFLGALALLITAVRDNHKYFVLLEVVVIIGTLVAFFPITVAVKSGIMLVLSLVALVALKRDFKPESAIAWVSVAGILTLALGYAISDPWIYLIGGVLLTIYALAEIQKGIQIAWFWLILNGLFSVSAVLAVFSVV